MKLFEYERDQLGDNPKIKIESIEEKVRFLVQVLRRLKKMYIEGVMEREGKDNEEYPMLPEVEEKKWKEGQPGPEQETPLEE